MNKELEDQFYEQVAREIAGNNYQPAPMARAVEKSAGNPDLAKSLYVKFRVEQLVRDFKQESRRKQLEAEQDAREQSRLQAIALEKRRQEELAAEKMKPERIQQELRRKQAIAERKTKLTSFWITLLVILMLLYMAFILSCAINSNN